MVWHPALASATRTQAIAARSAPRLSPLRNGADIKGKAVSGSRYCDDHLPCIFSKKQALPSLSLDRLTRSNPHKRLLSHLDCMLPDISSHHAGSNNLSSSANSPPTWHRGRTVSDSSKASNREEVAPPPALPPPPPQLHLAPTMNPG